MVTYRSWQCYLGCRHAVVQVEASCLAVRSSD